MVESQLFHANFAVLSQAAHQAALYSEAVAVLIVGVCAGLEVLLCSECRVKIVVWSNLQLPIWVSQGMTVVHVPHDEGIANLEVLAPTSRRQQRVKTPPHGDVPLQPNPQQGFPPALVEFP